MKTISVINYKGGVGKTTITANLIAELAARGKKILAVDLDPQASLTFSFVTVDHWKDKLEKAKTIKSWYDAFIDKDADLNLSSLTETIGKIGKSQESIDIISSHLALINVDLDLATRLVGGTERDLRNNFLRIHSRLKAGLATIQDKYDYIFIDCPPNFNIVTKTAIAASDYLLIPTKPDYLSTLGIEQLKYHVAELVKKFNNYCTAAESSEWSKISPKILGIVFTMIQLRNREPISAQQPYIEQVRRLGLPIMETNIRENKSIYASAPEYGVPVVMQKVTANTTYSEVQEELESLASEVLRKAV
jgi:chromosome partitioning protein